MNLRNFLNNKKKILIPLVIFLILIAGGFFYWWWQQPISQLRLWWAEEIKMGGGIKDFLIKEISGETIVENKREGLIVNVPRGWRVEKEAPEAVFYAAWGVHLSSSDLEVIAYAPQDLYLLQKGCLIDVRIEKNELHYNRINRYIENVTKAGGGAPILEEEGFRVIEINGHKTVEEVIYDGDNGIRIEVRLPIKDNKNIYFLFTSSLQDKERCLRIFEDFLETVSVK